MWFSSFVAFLTISTPNALQASGLKSSAGAPSEIASMLPGDQQLLNDQSSVIDFAGRKIALEAFTGIIGYASDVAYL
jgi:hypothetical protein